MNRLDHINLVVRDLEAAAHFFERVLGARRSFEAGLEGPWFERVCGVAGARARCLFLEWSTSTSPSARLELLCFEPTAGANGEPRPEPDAGAQALGWRHVAFEVDEFEATLDRALALGATLVSEPVEVPFRVADLGRKRLVYLRGPEGVLVEIASYERTA